MGEKDVKSSAGTIGEVEPIGTAEAGEAGSAGNSNSNTTGSTGSSTGRKRGRKPKTGSTEGKQSEKNSEILDLNLPDVNIPSTEEKPKRGRKSKKSLSNDTLTAEQFSALIVSVSAMIASRDGMQHWMITDSEAQQIAKPLSNIIAKSESLKSLGEHADAFALITACIMIFAPRLIITMQTKKKKKKQKGVLPIDKPNTGNNDGKSNTSNKALNKNEDTSTVSNDVKSFLDSVSLGF